MEGAGDSVYLYPDMETALVGRSTFPGGTSYQGTSLLFLKKTKELPNLKVFVRGTFTGSSNKLNKF